MFAFRQAAARSLRGEWGMQTVKEQYWRYSLFVLIVGLGIAIFVELTPFLGGALGASTIYVLLRGQMRYLTERRKWRQSMAAMLLIGESVLCFLVPISLIIWALVTKLQVVAQDPHALIGPVKHIAELFHQKTGYNLFQESNVSTLMTQIPRIGQWIVRSLLSFSINIVVLLFVLYFMLIGGSKMEEYVRDIMPFDRPVTSDVMREIHMIVRSNAIGIPLLALIQGLVAYLGYLAFGAPSPLFWGLLTCFATIIPIVGTALVWLPLAAFMAMAGAWGGAVGLVLYGGLVVTHVDNVVRFVMQKKMADTHPLVTIFGVFAGLALFGFMGVIFGPLMLSLFLLCVDIFKKRYLDGTSDTGLFVPGSMLPEDEFKP